MESEGLVKKVIAVYTEIERRLVDKSFRFSQGGATSRTISNFLDELKKEYGTISIDRVVDFCICTAHFYSDKEQRPITHKFGKASIKRFKESKRGKRYYEDVWLEQAGLTRSHFYDMVSDKSAHPQAKYIYVAYEENTKKRLLNQELGYLICQTSTLGWAPLSAACNQCNFTDSCKRETELRYPELYRIRLEHGSKDS